MSKIDQARAILEEVGLPKKQHSDVACLTLLALANIGPRASWRKAKQRKLRIHDIMQFAAERYRRTYAENTREVFRRQVIHQFEHARIVDKNPDDPERPTNSGLTCYALTSDFHALIATYGTSAWPKALRSFLKKQGKLSELYDKRKRQRRVPVTLPSGKTIKLSPGKHNKLQASVVSTFVSEFAPHAKLLYLGDTAKKVLQINRAALKELAVPVDKHEKLADVVLFDPKREWLYLIEAVTTHGPVTRKRKFELERLLKRCPAARVYVSAFATFADFRKWAKDIAWETEVWIAEHGSHMIHFNGNRFLG
jgi:type II restriction enzyme